jgi:16S rRNA processing protein RimM
MPRGARPSAAGSRICVAQIGAPHGVRGELRLKSFTEDPLAVSRYGPLESEDGARRFEIASARPAKDVLVVQIKGVDDRTAAEALKNLRLYVPRERLDPPADDEFYHADLIGLIAVAPDGSTVGKVVAVPNFGAGDLIEIAPMSGGPSVLVPFTRVAVPEVDIAAGRIVIDPPEGTFEAPAEPDRKAGTA